jgi:flagellar biosynthetic protein FlhB
MSESNSQDRTLEPTEKKLQQARARGDVPMSREGSAAGVYLAALIGILMTAGLCAERIQAIILPLIDLPDQLLDFTPEGLRQAGRSVALALGLAILPFFGLLIAGALLPHLMGGSVTFTTERFQFKASHLSPIGGLKRLFSLRGLFEFGKTLTKAVVIGVTSVIMAMPIYQNSISLVSSDFTALPGLLRNAVVGLLSAATVIAVLIAGVDVPYQHISYRTRMRMSIQEVRDEMRSTEGDPHLKAKLRRLRRQRARRRMMQAVPKATVVITNPTHFAVALRYDRGKDAAPVVVAKGQDLIAQRIRKVAAESGVAVIENPPLARALHATVEIGEVIPQEHFEAVAKVIGLVWAQRKAAGR